jgi:hypothetical protein
MQDPYGAPRSRGSKALDVLRWNATALNPHSNLDWFS